MPDLIIKPSTGNLKIQDDQDTDRIVIAPTTGVTTLSNQAFPAGHVIQTVSSNWLPGDNNVTTTSTSYVAPTAADGSPSSDFQLTITPKSSSNKIITMWHVNGHKIENSAANCIIAIYRSINSGGYTNITDQTYGIAHTYNTNNVTSSFSYTDTSLSGWSSGAVIYKSCNRNGNTRIKYARSNNQTQSY